MGRKSSKPLYLCVGILESQFRKLKPVQSEKRLASSTSLLLLNGSAVWLVLVGLNDVFVPPELSSNKTFFLQVYKGVRDGTKNATFMILGSTCVAGQPKRFRIRFDIFPFEMKIQGCEIERWISPIFWLFQFLPILPIILPSHLIFQRFQKVFPPKNFGHLF